MAAVTNSNSEHSNQTLTYEMVTESARFVHEKFPSGFKPQLALVTGSGLGDIIRLVDVKVHIPYNSIPNFPPSTVKGHGGAMAFGTMKGKDIIVMEGRIHPYEGHPHWRCAFYIWVLKELGVSTLFLTNASGSLNPALRVGQLVVLRDQIDLPTFNGGNALYGLADKRLNPLTFVPMADAYDPELRRTLLSCGNAENVPLVEGTYILWGGPTYETVAECRMLRAFGADLVGMSTTYETVVARALGMRVAGVSLVTDVAPVEYGMAGTTHEEVLHASKDNSDKFIRLVAAFVERF